MKSDTKKHHILKTIPDSGSSGCLSEGQTALFSFSVRVRRIRYFSGNVRSLRNFSGHVRLPQEKFRRSTSHPGKNSAGPPLTPPNFRLRISSPSPLPLLYFSPSLFPPSHDDRRLFRPDFISHTGYNPKNTHLKKPLSLDTKANDC